MGNTKRKCNSIVKLSKFIYNKKILNKFVAKFCSKANVFLTWLTTIIFYLLFKF